MLAHRKNLPGFTMIELLIVMAILGILATFVTVTFPAARRRARDTRRISDIKQYQTAMELYANRNNGSYYATSTAINSAFCTAINLTNCQYDPISTTPYQYRGTVASYVIWATLEQRSPTNAIRYIVTCSDGRTGETTTQPNSAVCPALTSL